MVYTLTTSGTVIVKEVMPKTTPIVFSIVTYPADTGLIESFEYSGNNLVGTSNYVDLKAYIRLLKQVLPDATRAAIFHRKGEPNSKIQAAGLIRLLKKEGVSVVDLEPESIEQTRAMAEKQIGKVDVFISTTDTLMQSGGEAALAQVSQAAKIPILSSNKAGIEHSSTFGPVADFYVLGKMSGQMAVKILRDGARPAELQSQVQDPPINLINTSNASALGIHLSEDRVTNIRLIE